MFFTGWETGVVLLKQEVLQKEFEGCRVPERLKDEIRGLGDTDAGDDGMMESLWEAIGACTPDPSFKYIQPSDFDGIRKLRPGGPRNLAVKLTDDELLDKFHGAWTGRACGCALGKPVECRDRKDIKRYLVNRNDWPLRDYFSGKDAGDGIRITCERSYRENIRFMEPDDDIHYTLMGLYMLEDKGADFTWWQVADAWNTLLPYNAICTAETQAIMNYNIMTPRCSPVGRKPLTSPSFTRTHCNPYREWIGAQIRADGWAYCCAGNPEKAAELAYRDACWTHAANGIYGEMFFAAVIAASFVESDPDVLIDIGLSEIPAECILSEAVGMAKGWVRSCRDFEEFMDRLEAQYPGMSMVHTINNALIVVMSLYYGKMDTLITPAIAVMAGCDTDCNGATAGSIVGASAGRKRFCESFARPLNDTIIPRVLGFERITMKELSERTLKVYKKINGA